VSHLPEPENLKMSIPPAKMGLAVGAVAFAPAPAYATTALFREPVKVPAPVAVNGAIQGNCDLCGHWDGDLVQGVGACCRDRYGLNRDRAAPAQPRRGWQCVLPCNEHATRALHRALAALIVLDELGAVVVGIEIGTGTPTIPLQQPPRPGTVAAQHEVCRREHGELQRFMRAVFMRCTVEWKLP
jgi:hypothetical protein